MVGGAGKGSGEVGVAIHRNLFFIFLSLCVLSRRLFCVSFAMFSNELKHGLRLCAGSNLSGVGRRLKLKKERDT